MINLKMPAGIRNVAADGLVARLKPKLPSHLRTFRLVFAVGA